VSTLEREIIEKLHQLQPAAQQRVRALIEHEIAAEAEQAENSIFDYGAWMSNAEALRQQIRASHGDQLPAIDVVGLLRDIRDGEDECAIPSSLVGFRRTQQKHL
jgi:hypothetical protein